MCLFMTGCAAFLFNTVNFKTDPKSSRTGENGNMIEKIPMTPAGNAVLKEERERRASSERPRIIAAIAEARAHGDLSENAEYHAAKEQQSLNEGRLKELEAILALAEIIDVKTLSGTVVRFGATVTIVNEDTNEEKTFQIVGNPEADAGNGKISISSPISRAMISKQVGDSFELSAPGGAKTYEILSVEYI